MIYLEIPHQIIKWLSRDAVQFGFCTQLGIPIENVWNWYLSSYYRSTSATENGHSAIAWKMIQLNITFNWTIVSIQNLGRSYLTPCTILNLKFCHIFDNKSRFLKCSFDNSWFFYFCCVKTPCAEATPFLLILEFLIFFQNILFKIFMRNFVCNFHT